MRNAFKALTPLFMATLLASPIALQAQAPAPAPASGFSQAQLEQLVAPIALYPDSLLTQLLMASTYPLEIVEAQRWLAKNPGLTGSALDEALKGQDWDPSVKSMCGFPEVVARMGDNLDWTQDLGDAFLGQKSQLLDAVQTMRGKAYSGGTLKSSEQQVVKQEENKIIVIESASPEVIYVPTYSPSVVYVGWSYPSYYYPALYVPPPPGYGALAFTAGVMWGAAVWGNCNWGWGHGDIDIDVNRYNNFNRNTSINTGNINRVNAGANGKGSWNHDPSHRKGVNYGSSSVAQKYGGSGASNRVTSQQARGWSGGTAGAGARPSTGSTGAGQRPSAGASQRPHGGAYSGASSASFDRSASSRGASSRGATSYGGSRSSGGFSGGGGGARGGGGGRGGGRR